MLRLDRHSRVQQHGQVLVVSVLAIIAMMSMLALLLEGGNAYAQQRGTQNGVDAAANAGAVALARKLAGSTITTTDVGDAVQAIANANALPAYTAYYTDVSGNVLDAGGHPAQVGIDAIPSGAQGVTVAGSRTFGTTVGGVIGINSLTASADATAITGPLTGGPLLPIVFPINIVDCVTNGDLGTSEDFWVQSNPGDPPDGPEYIVPLCKTGGGSFMILNLDDSLSCAEELATPPSVTWYSFPVQVPSDNGNDCAKKLLEGVLALKGTVVNIPICSGDCVTSGGSHAEYTITKVAAFYLDAVLPMSDKNGGTNPLCQAGTSPSGYPVTTIAGNGSDSCLIGWFVKYITEGPVGPGSVGNSDSIGVQLIK